MRSGTRMEEATLRGHGLFQFQPQLGPQYRDGMADQQAEVLVAGRARTGPPTTAWNR